MKNRAVLIAGPTASGKSAVASHLACRLGGVVINADSMQIYRELRVLTARPSREEQERVPHALYGIVSVREPFSVGRWLTLARAAIEHAWAVGQVPIVVGGTGLYFEALTQGLAAIPDIPHEVRTQTRALVRQFGAAGLHARLAARDPCAAARLRPSDTQRIARAWEVLVATGRSILDWQGSTTAPPIVREPVRMALIPPRPVLYARCNVRLGEMIERGALDEVRGLAAMRLPAHLPAMRAVGVRHLLSHVRKELPLDQALDQARTATRQYAKRQMTWLRNRMGDWPVIADAEWTAVREATERLARWC